MQKTKNDFLQDFEKQTKPVQAILCLMAFSFHSIGRLNIGRILRIMKVKALTVETAIATVKKLSDYLYLSGGRSGKFDEEYKLYTSYALELFVLIVRSGQTEYFGNVLTESYLEDWLRRKTCGQLRGAFISYVTHPKTPIVLDEYVLDEEAQTVLIQAILSDGFKGIEQQLPQAVNRFLFQKKVACFEEYLDDLSTIDTLFALFTASTTDPNERSFYKDLYAIKTLLLGGKLNEIPAQVSSDTPVGLYLQGVYQLQIEKEAMLAIKYFERGIKMAKNSSHDILPAYSVFCYAYALALCEVDTPAVLKKINMLFKKSYLQSIVVYLPAYLLFAIKLNREKEEILQTVERYRSEISFMPVVCTLVNTILRGNSMQEHEINLVLKGFFLSDWLTLEQLSVSPKESENYQILSDRLGYLSLIAQIPVEEEWEKTLNLLINSHTPISKKAKACSKKTSRVAYQISLEYRYIQPILQTSSDGETWTIGRNIALSNFANGKLTNPTEADIQMNSAISVTRSYYGRVEYSISFDKALFILIGHPALYLYGDPLVPMELISGKPELIITKGKEHYLLKVNVSDTTDVQLIQETTTRYQVIKMDSKLQGVIHFLKRMPKLPLQSKSKLLSLIAILSDQIQIHSDLIDLQSESLVKITADSRIIVQLLPIGSSLKAELFVKPFATQPPYCRAGCGAKSILATVEGATSQAIRAMDKEIANRNVVYDELQLITDPEDHSRDSFLFETPAESLEMLECLEKHNDIMVIEWPEGVKYKLNKPVGFSSLSFAVKADNNWLEVNGDLQVDEELVVSIQTLLTAVKNGGAGRFVELNPGEYIALTEQLHKQLSDMNAAGIVDKNGKLQLPKYNAPIIDNFKNQGSTLKGNRLFNALLKNLKEVETRTYPVPKQLKAELRDYQAEGFRWMARLSDWGAGACLADDMGLGKTIQTIAMLLHKASEGASLVISPASVLLNWRREINRFAPSLQVLVLNEATDRKQMVEEAESYDVVLVTFGLLVNEEASLTTKKWIVAAIDEAHTIKNKETKASKVAMQLQGEFRLLLTGTPIQNHLGEVWNLFSFITPGLLGSFEHFTECFINPIEQDKDKVQQKRLKQFLSPFLLRRTKQAVLDELPSKTEIVMEIDMSEEEKAYYEVLRREAELSTLQSTASERIKILAEITKLRMAACNVNLVNKQVKMQSAKTDALLQIVDELMENGHRALVFSQFTTELALLQEALTERGIEYIYLDGSVAIPKREKLVKEFQTGTVPLFLISLKAGGLGLNLTAADFVIHMDPWWNPAIEDQASDRVYRIGQERPVTIYRLIARGTIEEKIIKLHAFKKDLADSLLEGSDLSARLTQEELLELLKM